MNSILSTVLVSAPLAFVAGWIVSKAVVMSSRSGAAPASQKPAEQARETGADDRDAQIAELQHQLDVAEARLRKSRRSFKTWRERIRPIAQQFRQQRMIISELRDELRRRDMAAQQAEEAALLAKQQAAKQQKAKPAPGKRPAAKAESGAV